MTGGTCVDCTGFLQVCGTTGECVDGSLPAALDAAEDTTEDALEGASEDAGPG
jgi:hypothetical protein